MSDTSHSFQHQTKNGKCGDAWLISWHIYSSQVDTTGPILYFYYAGNAYISVIWNAISKFVSEKLMQFW